MEKLNWVKSGGACVASPNLQVSASDAWVIWFSSDSRLELFPNGGIRCTNVYENIYTFEDAKALSQTLYDLGELHAASTNNSTP